MFLHAYIFATRCIKTFNSSTYEIYKIKQFKFESIKGYYHNQVAKILG